MQVFPIAIALRSRDSSVQSMWQLAKEFFRFLREEKKWWLIPLIALLLLLAAVLIFGTSSVLAPFMYPFL